MNKLKNEKLRIDMSFKKSPMDEGVGVIEEEDYEPKSARPDGENDSRIKISFSDQQPLVHKSRIPTHFREFNEEDISPSKRKRETMPAP